MKKIVSALGLSLLASAAVAQTTLDDFESGIADWTFTGYSEMSAIGDDGANSTTNCAEIIDAGWSKGAAKDFTVAAAGTYIVTFYYKNGDQTGKNPWPDLGVRLNGDAATKVDLGSTAVTDWTAAQTNAITIANPGDTLTVEILGSSSAQADNECRFDEFVLEELAVIPINVAVTPLSGDIFAGSVDITAVPSGGSGTFTQVEFDLGDDGSVEYTDTTPGDGFVYPLDTTGLADGAISVKATATDDAAGTGSTTVDYSVDNFKGRETLLTEDFETWESGLPAGWTKVDLNADDGGSVEQTVTIDQETTDPYEGATALHINYTTNPSPNRYTLMSPSFAGDRQDYLMSVACKGGTFVRTTYFETTDGTTWIGTYRLLTPESTASVWAKAIDDPFNTGSPSAIAICTHFYGTGDAYWDDLTVTASEPPSSNSSWDLYDF